MTNEEIAGLRAADQVEPADDAAEGATETAAAELATDQVEPAAAVTDAPAEAEQSTAEKIRLLDVRLEELRTSGEHWQVRWEKEKPLLEEKVRLCGVQVEESRAARKKERDEEDARLRAELDAADKEIVPARAVETERRAAVQAVEKSIREARAEIARLAAADELSGEDLLAQENERRRVRRLGEDLTAARAALDEAEQATVKAVSRKTSLEYRIDRDRLDAMDEDYVADIKATVERFRNKRAAIWQQMRRLSSGPFDPRRFGTQAGCSNPNDEEFTAALEVLQRHRAIHRGTDVELNPGVYMTGKPFVYRPPRDGNGNLNR